MTLLSLAIAELENMLWLTSEEGVLILMCIGHLVHSFMCEVYK